MKEKFFAIRTWAWIEMGGFFVFLFLVAWIFNLPRNYFNVVPHPFWLLVIFFSAQYGTKEGLMAAVCSTLALLLAGPLPVRSIVQERYEYFFLLAKTPLLWGFIALTLGELRMKQIREMESLKISLQQVEEKEQQIANSYAALKKIKERLEVYVASDMKTALMEIAAFKQMGKKNESDVLQGGFNLIQTLVSPEKFSIYLLKNQHLDLLLAKGWEAQDTYLQSYTSEHVLFQEIVRKKAVVSAQSSASILQQEGVLAIPILKPESEEVWGMIKIEKMPFLRVTTATIDTLHMIADCWVERYVQCQKGSA
ncbi:MAG: GAF domain-containing protein [Verrucomicrobia bacterium]|nr:GAF domain-containing protein [Verrucomicrobiota bacterium]MBS0646750.1 GAF domain-containing protein [Verrucomicrobiota bacterium]